MSKPVVIRNIQRAPAETIAAIRAFLSAPGHGETDERQ